MRYIEDTIAAIRLRTRHRDPYEEWEQQTRKDAFVSTYIDPSSLKFVDGLCFVSAHGEKIPNRVAKSVSR